MQRVKAEMQRVKAERKIAALYASKSWRLMRPLRGLGRATRALLRWPLKRYRAHHVQSEEAAFLASKQLHSSERLSVGSSEPISAGDAKHKILLAYQALVPEAVRAIPHRLRGAVRRRPLGGILDYTARHREIAAAEAAMRRKDWLAAAEHWNASIKLSGQGASPAVYAKLSRAYLSLGKLEKAAEAAHGVREKHAMNPMILVAKANIATARQNWSEAIARWQLVIESKRAEASPTDYANLSEAYRKLGEGALAKKALHPALENFPNDSKLRTELARAEMAQGNWDRAVDAWDKALDCLEQTTQGHASARYGKGISKRLADIATYRRQVNQYADRRSRRSQKSAPRVALYTAIVSNYDTLKLPQVLNERVDYIVYADRPLTSGLPYTVRPITYFNADPTRTARYIKTHPHTHLGDYDVAVWIDANICLLEDIYPFVRTFLNSKEPVAGIKHPTRESLLEEAAACIKLGKDDRSVIEDQMNRYRSAGFDCNDLVESNVMMFDLRDERTSRFLNDWWQEIDKGSKRDQLSINYALRNHSITPHALLEPPLTARNHPSFVLVKHGHGDLYDDSLLEALNGCLVNPYSGRSYSEIREKRLGAHKNTNIDVIVCVHNALEDVKTCLASIAASRKSARQHLIIIDDGSETETARFLDDFVKATPWASLHRNETPQGYTKAANKGLAASTGELVIVLNSDTVVTSFWAEKLADAVFSTSGAGIVGPLSNAASYQSIPNHRGSKDQTAINPLPPHVTPEDMNCLCEDWSIEGTLPLVPLIHGFCFGITRETIDRIGYFDEKQFPRGYGEENDYCFRAADAGIGLVVATHTYVFHSKSKSFADEERIGLMKAGSVAFRERHGTARVKRAIESMDKNPLLVKVRENAANVFAERKGSTQTDSSLGDALLSGDYDFLDFGSSEGGSLRLAKSKLGGVRGIGIDRSIEKVRIARAKGFNVIEADALDLHGYPDAVSFVVMNHFLEHLPGTKEAKQCIEAASVVARDFIFIKHPWFDLDGELFRRGLKLYWSDWRGHPNHLTTLELHECISGIQGVDRWAIYGRDRIFDSIHSAVHPVQSPDEQHAWNTNTHPPKPAVEFDFPVYRETVCLIQMAGSMINPDLLLKGFPGLHEIHESSN